MIVVRYHSLDWDNLVEFGGWRTAFVEGPWAWMVRADR